MRKSLIYQSLANGFSSGSSVAELFLSIGGRFKKAVSFIEKGLSLEEAVAKSSFPVVEKVFLVLGEQTGRLEEVCKNLSDYYALKEEFYSKVISIFLKTVVILLLGGFLAFLLFSTSGNPVPKSLGKFVLILSSLWFIVLFLFVFLNPGFSKYLSVFILKTAYSSGLSFLESKTLLKDLGFFYNKKAEYFHQLIPLKKEYKIFLESSEKSGTLESAFDKVLGFLESEYRRKINNFETMFFYASIVGAAIIVFYSIYLFAANSFSDIFDQLL